MEECSASCIELGPKYHSASWYARGAQGNCQCAKGTDPVGLHQADWVSCELISFADEITKTPTNPNHNRCPTCDYLNGMIFVSHTSTPSGYHEHMSHMCSMSDGICGCH